KGCSKTDRTQVRHYVRQRPDERPVRRQARWQSTVRVSRRSGSRRGRQRMQQACPSSNTIGTRRCDRRWTYMWGFPHGVASVLALQGASEGLGFHAAYAHTSNPCVISRSAGKGGGPRRSAAERACKARRLGLLVLEQTPGSRVPAPCV